MTTADGSGRPLVPVDQVQQALVLPVTRTSIAARVSTQTTTANNEVHIPIVTGDPSTDWVAEGEEINPSNSTFNEITVTPSKVAGLTVISRELAEDSTPGATDIISAGLSRDIVTKIDAAYFGALAAPAPSGLGALTGVTAVDAGDSWEAVTIDPFIVAMSNAATVGATITAFVTNPADELALARLKQATGSNLPLLEVTRPTDTDAPVRTIAGVPLYVTTAVAPGTVWGIPQAFSQFVLRESAELAVDQSAFFTSDRVAIRATMRVGFAFPYPQAVQHITLSTGA
ncbi:phage major capsid protein [Corynebacterium variabile]|nr:phage major capsid protein [Corynebacterium variabile]